MKRLFLAAWPDGKTASVLESYQRELKLSNSEVDAIRWTQPNQWHLTLQFLGNVQDQEISPLVYRLRAQDWAAFPSVLQSLESLFLWPTPSEPRVWAVGSSDCTAELQALRDRLCRIIEAEGLWSDRKPFQPHVTLARQKESPQGAPLHFTRQSRRILFPVTRFHLVQSTLGPQGSTYQVLADFELAPSSF